MDEIEKKAAELKAQLKEEIAKEIKSEIDTLKADRDSLAKQIADLTGEGKGASKEVVELKQSIENIDKSLEKIQSEIKDFSEKKESRENFVANLEKVVYSEEFKKQVQEVIEKKRQSTSAFEVKTDPESILTTGYTGDVMRTMGTNQIWSASWLQNKFLAAMTNVTIPQDKNRAIYIDGTYFSNVGYVSEMTAITTGDGASVQEKYREIAKVGAKLTIASETITDFSVFVNWAKSEGLKAVLNDIDTKIYSGDGADGGAYTKHIYGLKTSYGSTAFSAVTAGLTTSITAPNLADLLLAMSTQIKIQSNEQYVGKVAYINPSNVAKLRALKNTNQDYINILPDNSFTVHGILINEYSKVGITEVLLVDPSTLMLYQKGSMEVEMERIASTDSYCMYMRWRGNVVVPTFARLGNVFVANIDTALAALTYATPTTVAPTTTAAPTTGS